MPVRLLVFGVAVLGACGSPRVALRAQTSPRRLVSFDLTHDGARARLEVAIAEPDDRITRAQVELTAAYVRLIDKREIGDHTGDGIPEVAVHFVQRTPATTACAYPLEYPVLVVIDPVTAKVIARAAPPIGSLCATVPTYENPRHTIPPIRAYADYAAGPHARLYPFLAPPYGDGDPVYTSGRWGYTCVFHPGAGPTDCGIGFAKIAELGKPTSKGLFPFREAGGLVFDVDRDGWDEILLIYHYTLQVISVRAVAAVDTVSFNVAHAEHPKERVTSATWLGIAPVSERLKHLHSGRNFAIFSAFADTRGARITAVAGSPVGAFDEYMCNVSRFAAALATDDSGRLGLAWSVYYGFQSSTFSRFDPDLAAAPPVDRLGDFTNGCIHRFSDARTVLDGRGVVLIDVFHTAADADRCLPEQYALYLPPATNWGDAKYEAWLACAKRSRDTAGDWTVEALDARTGELVASVPRSYVWGWSDRVLPGGRPIYVVESWTDRAGFDLDRRTEPRALHLAAFDHGHWTDIAAFPAGAARPLVRAVQPHGPIGTGAFTTLAELSFADRDGDGLVDIELMDHTWIGYDARAPGTLSVKR
jgi:hypothetical protein